MALRDQSYGKEEPQPQLAERPAPPPRPNRWAKYLLIAFAAVVVIAIGVYWYVHTADFQRRVGSIVATQIHDNTGADAVFGRFHFSFAPLGVDIRDVVLHGRESAGQQPLARVDHVYIGIGLSSLLPPKVDLREIVLDQPDVHVYMLADGSTNLPTPPKKNTPANPNLPPAQPVFDLGINTLRLSNGAVYLSNRKLPLNAELHNASIRLRYQPNASGQSGAYDGYIAYDGGTLRYANFLPVTQRASLQFTLWPNDLRVDQLMLEGDGTKLVAKAKISNLADPTIDGGYHLTSDIGRAGRIARMTAVSRGTATVEGNIRFHGTTWGTDGKLAIDGVELAPPAPQIGMVSVAGHFGASQAGLNIPDLAITGLGGVIRLRGSYKDWKELHAFGDISNLQVRRLIEAATPQPSAKQQAAARKLAGLVNGHFQAQSLGTINPNLTASVNMTITPPKQLAAGEQPVSGVLVADTQPFRQAADIRQLRLAIAGTSASASGRIASSGMALNVGTNSPDLDQLRPLLGIFMPPTQLPAIGGSATVQGTISGRMQNPLINARLQAQHLRYGTYTADTLLAAASVGPSGLTLRQGVITLGNQRVTASGSVGLRHYAVADSSPLNLQINAQNIDLASAQKLAGKQLGVAGTLNAQTAIQGTKALPQARGTVSIRNLSYGAYTADSVLVTGAVRPSQLSLTRGLVTLGNQNITASGTVGLRNYAVTDTSAINVHLNAQNIDLARAQKMAGRQLPVTGLLNVRADVQGTKANPLGNGAFALRNAVVEGQPIRAATADLRFSRGAVESNDVLVQLPHSSIGGSVRFGLADESYAVNISTKGIPLSDIAALQSKKLQLAGLVKFDVQGQGTVQRPAGTVHLEATNLQGGGEALGNINATVVADGNLARFNAVDTRPEGLLTANGTLGLRTPYALDGAVHLRAFDIDALLRRFTSAQVTGHNFIGGDITVRGPLTQPANLVGQVNLSPVHIALEGITLNNDGPILASLTNQVFTLQQLRIVGTDTRLAASGRAQLRKGGAISAAANGNINLAILQLANPDVHSSGQLLLDARATGTTEKPVLGGNIQIHDGSLAEENLPVAFDRIEGNLLLNQNRLDIQQLTANTGGGKLTVLGYAAYNPGVGVNADVTATGSNLRVRYQGVSATGDLNLRMAGANTGGLLSGDVSLNRIALDPNFDVAVLIANQKATVSEPNPDSLLNKIRLDVHLVTGPQVEIATNVARVQLAADLRARGTAANPVLLGRASASEGEIQFAGNKYTINKAQLTFANPFRIDPLIDFGLSTTVQQYDITLNVNGSTDKLNVSYRSDPPLASSDIISLLATGQTAEHAQLVNSQTPTTFTSESEQLLGKALDNLVASRLQRLFGITQLQINPNLGNNPNASTDPALTIQQQISRNLKLTYSHFVGKGMVQGSQEAVSVDYTLTKHLGVSVSRDEFGLYGLAFHFRHRAR